MGHLAADFYLCPHFMVVPSPCFLVCSPEKCIVMVQHASTASKLASNGSLEPSSQLLPRTSRFTPPNMVWGSLLLVSSQLIHPTWMENQHIQEYRQKMLGMIDLT